MGDAMKITNYDNTPFQLGDNEFETGTVTVAAGATLTLGALLVRSAPGVFAPATGSGSEEFVAVNPVELKNEGSASAALPFRAMIAGRVSAKFLNIAGTPATPAQLDGVRKYGITPFKVNSLGVLDNQ
jgi:hypothetical protein